MACVEEASLKVVVCEPYFTGSHRSWAEGLVRHSAHDLRLVTHGGGFWKWRMQGAALTLAEEISRLVSRWGRPDVLVTSEMVHLPAVVGFARSALAGVPVVLYLHENQLTYPLPRNSSPDHTYAMTNWLSMAAADRVVFNSEHHRNDVFAQLPKFLRRFPDHRHLDHLDRVQAAACVLPIGIDLDRFRSQRTAHQPPIVLWNHRWEYDKDPAAFFTALAAVAERGVVFGVIVAGESFQTIPDVFAAGRDMLGDRLLHFGTASDDEYPQLLAQADVVVSTARHEFFGVAVLEAIAAGALPVLPNRLSYPKLVPSPRPYLYDHPDELVDRLCWALSDHAGRERAATQAGRYVERFAWPAVAAAYDELLASVARPEPRPRRRLRAPTDELRPHVRVRLRP